MRSRVVCQFVDEICKSCILWMDDNKSRKGSTVASKSEVYLWLRLVPLLEVIGEIRMGDIAEVRSTLVNGDQDQWINMKGTRSMDMKEFG